MQVKHWGRPTSQLFSCSSSSESPFASFGRGPAGTREESNPTASNAFQTAARPS